MWRTCGAAPSGPLGVERRALADAEAVLLVDHADRQPGERDVGLDQRVGADDQRRARRRRAGRAPRAAARAGVAPVSSANGIGSSREQPVEGRGVLLGEGLGRRHQRRLVARPRPRAASRTAATTVLPAADLPHQQPLHRRSRRRGRRRSPRARARWSPVGSNGSDSSQRSTSSAGGPSATPGALACGPGGAPRAPPGAGRAPRRRAARGRARPPRGSSREVRRRERVARRRQAGGAARSSAGSGSIALRASGTACHAHSRIRCGAQPLGGRVDRDDARWCGGPAGPRPPPRAARARRPETPRARACPCSSSRVPGCSRSASHAWLNQTAFIGPVLVRDLRLDDVQARAAGSGARAPSDLDHDRRLARRSAARPSCRTLGAVAVASGGRAAAGRRASRCRARPRPPRAWARRRAAR